MSDSSNDQQPTREFKARNLFIHCGETDPLNYGGRFWKCHGLSEESKTTGVAAADVGPDAMEEVHSADRERFVSSVRQRRRRQLEDRAAELEAQRLAEMTPVALEGEVLEHITSEEERRRDLLSTICGNQWLRLVEIGRASQIPIALGERSLGKVVKLTSSSPSSFGPTGAAPPQQRAQPKARRA